MVVVLARREGQQLGLEGLPPRRVPQEVLALMHPSESASVAPAAEGTGWQAHTARGFFTRLKKRQGILVAAARRVREVGPGKEGTKGSYTV